MTYQQPQPGQPQQPGWGQQPPPPRKRKTGKIIGFGCLGIVGLIVLIAVISMVASGGDDGGESSTTKPSATQGEAKKDEPKEEESAEKAPVTVTAKAVTFKKSVLAQGDDYTSVQVTITNNSRNDIEVNPLYVTITDTDGSKHTVELGVDEDQLDAMTLAPGENTTGTVTAKGTFDAKYVTYTDGLIGDSVRGDVS
ncbi:DUF4352 domain-containing protein [Streptomyces globisporus]|uniref:DUF4352 domain-containing protein n=1 Tax=Streptomyces globisporus TaxID=1908 RepID=A0ABM9H4E4_STRGL|nr:MULTISPECIES: DUF4352 domain-containing protein [Streptomyces]WSF80356.1 DUF4352 domain-containing protein [Streptomyces globisporus]WSQ95343.1 DUF4352 domain-containing protein [Streptomyces globisporus]WSU84829.1 DUF4352 domain-containing protein [Streptomyces globisporus]WSV93310.1 DUF4352 domain-containing protein [Streptomyces globisporus]CAH9418475.1 hypothetical protein SGL43_05524 [Streptomyces globisporus]